MGKTQPLKLFLIKRNLDNDNKFIRLFFKTHLTYEAVNLTVKHVNLKKKTCAGRRICSVWLIFWPYFIQCGKRNWKLKTSSVKELF